MESNTSTRALSLESREREEREKSLLLVPVSLSLARELESRLSRMYDVSRTTETHNKHTGFWGSLKLEFTPIIITSVNGPNVTNISPQD